MAYKYKMVNGKEVELTADEIKELEARDKEWADGEYDRLMFSIRQERTNLLAKTDWMTLSDSPTMSDAWKTYRQALRDLPASASPSLDSDGNLDLSSVTWPTEPS